MPKGPQGQKRPADMIGAAVKVMRIATGEIKEDGRKAKGAPMTAVEMGRKGGLSRSQKLSKKDRIAIAEKAARARWKKSK